MMTFLTDPHDVSAFVERHLNVDFVAVDTEFTCGQTYLPRLNLVQIAGPEEAVVIDAEAEGYLMDPVLKLMAARNVLKVFHGGRQDMEIFTYLMGSPPSPVFDTQIAAMFCGFGETPSYGALVGAFTDVQLDKDVRFIDWTQRPLSERQISYALADVTHLRLVYQAVIDRLRQGGRLDWPDESMAQFAQAENYVFAPEKAWKRLRHRAGSPRFLAILRELAAWRERRAHKQNLPRAWVLRDEAILSIASLAPCSPEALMRARGLPKNVNRGGYMGDIIAAVQRGLEIPESQCPQRDLPRRAHSNSALGSLLKVLVAMKAAETGVASSLIATAHDIDRLIACEDSHIIFQGWRDEIFGKAARALLRGEVSLAVEKNKVILLSG